MASHVWTSGRLLGDRREGRAAWPVCGLSVGGGRDSAPPVRHDPSSDRSVMPSTHIVACQSGRRRGHGRWAGREGVCSCRNTTIMQRRLAPSGPRRGSGTHVKTRRQLQTDQKLLDGGEFRSVISRLEADCPFEDGQMGNPRVLCLRNKTRNRFASRNESRWRSWQESNNRQCRQRLI